MVSSLLFIAAWGCSTHGERSDNPPDGGMFVDGGGEDRVRGVFRLPRVEDTESQSFFDLPWPSDLRRNADGTLDVSDWPAGLGLLQHAADAIQGETDGYSLSGSTYLRFSATVDESTLPQTPAASRLETASAFVINVDASSAHWGERHPVVFHYRDEATRQWPQHCVAVRPVFGATYEWNTRYAVVITDDVTPVAGGRFERDADLHALLSRDERDPAVVAAAEVYGPAIEQLERAGVDVSRIVNLAVFTTGARYQELLAARDFIHESYPEPTVDPSRVRRAISEASPDARGPNYLVVEGRYGPSPIFQRGEIPYTQQGGEFVVQDGVPLVQQDVEQTFAIAIPDTPMPAAGYPVVLYQHGDTGDYLSAFRRVGANASIASQLAAHGIATMGVNVIHHGDRVPPGTASSLWPPYLNLLNAQSLRDSSRQSALDVVQQARVVDALVIPADIAAKSVDVRLNPQHIFLFGHSRGEINSAIALGIDDGARAGVLSGGGGVWSISLVDYNRANSGGAPTAASRWIANALLVGGDDPAATEHLVYEHPVLTLLQTWLDIADPASYAHLILSTPRTMFGPKHLLVTMGTTDVPRASGAFAAAAGIPLVSPSLDPVESLAQLGREAVEAPVFGNLGAVTGGLVQFLGGHFVAFEPAGSALVTEFFRSAVVETAPIIQSSTR